LAYFCQQLVVYLDAGFDASKALRLLQPMFRSTQLRAAIGRILLALGDGETLSAAMARELGVIDGRFLRMVRDAEAQGRLQEALRAFARENRAPSKQSSLTNALLGHGFFLLYLAPVVVPTWILLHLPAALIAREAVAGHASLPRLVHGLVAFHALLPPWRGWVLCRRFESCLPSILLFAFLLMALPRAARWIVPIVDRCRRMLFEDDEPLRGADLLAEFEQIRSAGELTDAEFSRIRKLIHPDVRP
jgi:hypothetical protein